MKRKAYEELLESLQLELVNMARWVQGHGERVLVLFEGRDTAGKGGAIEAVSERLNPRQCRVVALPKPSEEERGQWYFQRFIRHLPARGEIVLFDRSWYNRAGVERVMGFATSEEVSAFLKAAPTFEKLLADEGIHLIKYWLSCDQAQQEERFTERAKDPLKRWKLSPIDAAARAKYAEYTAAREEMLAASHTEWAPWTIVDFNDQNLGRLTLIRDLLDRLAVPPILDDPVSLPPLEHPPITEEFGILKPIKSYTSK